MKKGHFVGCFIFDKNNNILLQFRGPFSKRLKNCWNCFGGKVENGEELEESLSRELLEELNIEINSFQHITSINFEEKENNYFGTLSYYKTVIPEEIKGQLKLLEGNGWGWFNKKEIMELQTTPNLKKIIQLLD